MRQKDQECKVILGYKTSLRLVWGYNSNNKNKPSWVVVAQVFNPSTQETKTSGSLSLRLVWPSELGQDSQSSQRNPISKKQNQNKKPKLWLKPLHELALMNWARLEPATATVPVG